MKSISDFSDVDSMIIILIIMIDYYVDDIEISDFSNVDSMVDSTDVDSNLDILNLSSN